MNLCSNLSTGSKILAMELNLMKQMEVQKRLGKNKTMFCFPKYKYTKCICLLISFFVCVTLKVQTSLKTKIEAQGRFLERIVEENRNRRASINPIPKHSKSFSPVSSQPSLCDESESNATNAGNFSQS
ncbi:hypothetical protein OIU85_016387 [Salix viminalis]|uniref:MYB-CC type transcription factor LHEQLE-containing domain-containing protein n=1 Tax=Salix viminalis TaxID=40686 RepID=A0A9Q0V5G6_SALVM|nr:hypothetical protein OIU85_016387 [Salix viminalis]